MGTGAGTLEIGAGTILGGGVIICFLVWAIYGSNVIGAGAGVGVVIGTVGV